MNTPTITLDVEPCNRLDCDHGHPDGAKCNPRPPCLIWPGDADCAGCLHNGTRAVLP